MKFCQNCGNQMEDSEVFCAKCGTKAEDLPQPGRRPGIGGSGLGAASMKLPIIVASVVVVIASVLPYLKVSALGMSQSMSLLMADDQIGDGLFFILFAIAAILGVTILKKPVVSVAASALNLLLCIYKMFQIQDLYRQFSIFSGMISKGPGYYLIIIGTIAALVLSVLNLLQAKKS